MTLTRTRGLIALTATTGTYSCMLEWTSCFTSFAMENLQYTCNSWQDSMVCLCPFRQQLEKDGQLPAQHQHKGQQAHLFNVRHLPLSESTVGGRKKKVHWTAVGSLGKPGYL